MFTPINEGTGVTVVLILINIFIILVAILINTELIFVLLKNKNLRTAENIIASNIFLAGAVGLCTTIFSLIGLFCISCEDNDRFLATRGGLFVFHVTYNVLSVTIIALHRANNIRKMRVAKEKLSVLKTTVVFLIPPIASIAATLLLPFGGVQIGEKGMGLITIACISTAAFVIITSYSIIGVMIWKSMKRTKNITSTSNNVHKKAINTINRVMAAFFVTHILLIIKGTIIAIRNLDGEELYVNLNYVNIISSILVSAGIIINPLVYFFPQKNLRKKVIVMEVFQNIKNKLTKNFACSHLENEATTTL